MPIVYVHGVNTRSRKGFEAIKPLLQRIVAPAIAPKDPENVSITDAYWGELAFKPAYGGISRPKTFFRGKGGDEELILPEQQRLEFALRHRDLIDDQPESQSDDGSIFAPKGGSGSDAPAAADGGLTGEELREQLSDRLALLALDLDVESEAQAQQRIDLLLAIDEVMDGADMKALEAMTPAQQIEYLLEKVEERLNQGAQFAPKGGGWFSALRDRFEEALVRVDKAPAFAASLVAAEARPKLNELISTFLGDVFVYLANRGTPDAPGSIPALLLETLAAAQKNKVARGGEPLVVVTHSMGGQLVWDAVTSFLPKAKDAIKIDFWCATASQVGFFEEAKVFLLKKDEYKENNPVPFPSAHLGHWWNVWDGNDFLSFRAEGICKGVDDGEYSSGSSLLAAHGGYFERPSFYRKLARKIKEAKLS